jgi:hypothetical protein
MSFIATFITETIVLKKRDDILIEQRNWLVHQDIESDIQRINNGLYSFTIKVVNGEITDYMPIENARYNLSQVS